MELNNSILGINTQDSIINDIFKNDIQYTHITGSVNLCVNRCGQEIDNCNEIHLMNMVNNGKILILNQNPEKSKNNKCNLKKAYDDDTVGEEFSSYKFEKMFVTTPSFNKIDGILYDCELGFIFSKIDKKSSKKKYIVLCVLANSALDSRPETLSKSGDLLFYKLTNELFKEVPNFSNKKEIAYPPNPIDLSNFFPPYGERSFYEYTYKNIPNISYRIFQRPMIISNSVLGNLREKLVPNKLYNQYKEALQSYENPKRNLLIFYKEDTDKPIIESLANQKESKISDLDKAIEDGSIEDGSIEDASIEDASIEDGSIEDNLNKQKEKNIENYETDFDTNNIDENNIEELRNPILPPNNNGSEPVISIPNVPLIGNENDEEDADDMGSYDTGADDTDSYDTGANNKRGNKLKKLNKKLDTPIKNSMMKMYIISILVILFQLSNQLFMSLIVNKQISGYKPDIELMNYIYTKTPIASTLYFINKFLNIISIFSLAILYVLLVAKGTIHNFSDTVISKQKDFKNILISIVIFLFISIFTNFISTLSRLFLPSEKYGELSNVDSIFNIDSIILYFTSSKNVSADCIKDENFKLSELFVNEEKNIQKFTQFGGASKDDSSNLIENLQYIMGHGLTQNVTKMSSFIMYFFYVFVIFVVLFNQFEESYALTTSNVKIYKNIYNSFIGSYIIMFIIFGLIFTCAFGLSIFKIMGELDESLSILKKLESLFRNPLFIIMVIFWVILLILVIIFGAVPKLKVLKGSKTFITIGIIIIVLLFTMVVFFLFEPIKQLYMRMTGITDLNHAPEWFKNIFQKKQEEHEGKSLNNIMKELSNKNTEQISKEDIKEINIPRSLEDRGTNSHLLRGLLGSIGVDSDLLRILEETPYTDTEIEELEKVVIQGLAGRESRQKIIQKLKETHLTNYGITKTINNIESNSGSNESNSMSNSESNNSNL